MKVGLSIYSLFDAIKKREMTVEQAIQWMADNGAEHFEVVGFVMDLMEGNLTAEERADIICRKAQEVNLQISTYCVAANLLDPDPVQADIEFEKIKANIEIAHRLGAKVMRSDLSAWGRPREENVIENFDRDLPYLISCCQKLADYAAKYDITLTIENHGTYINGGDRVRRLIQGVNRENYRCTLDIGNAICVDENPLICVEALLPYAVSVHFKDFYLRDNPIEFGDGDWMATNYGRWFRGAIVGHGELPVYKIMKRIKDFGYDGDISIEFEGMEDSRIGSKIGMDNVRRLANL